MADDCCTGSRLEVPEPSSVLECLLSPPLVSDNFGIDDTDFFLVDDEDNFSLS
jgi:hypothetical protein